MLKNRENLEKIIRSLESKVHSIVLEDREGQFLVDHSGSQVALVLLDGSKVQGELLDMDKNRICLKVDSLEIFYYKHAIKGYYRVD